MIELSSIDVEIVDILKIVLIYSELIVKMLNNSHNL